MRFINKYHRICLTMHAVIPIGHAENLIIRFYAISMQRKSSHPAVTAITEKAREWLFKKTDE